jgi:hypothetical protein
MEKYRGLPCGEKYPGDGDNMDSAESGKADEVVAGTKRGHEEENKALGDVMYAHQSYIQRVKSYMNVFITVEACGGASGRAHLIAIRNQCTVVI